ncbi:MAG: hypothetical protein QW606_02885 [Conexivisphaerales archaeon]
MQEIHFTQIRMLSIVKKRKLITTKGDDKERPTVVVYRIKKSIKQMLKKFIKLHIMAG